MSGVYKFRQFGLLTPRLTADGKRKMMPAPPGFPKYAPGEDLVLFLRPSAAWTGFRMPAGVTQGKFTIAAGRVENGMGNAGLFRNVHLDQGLVTERDKRLLTTASGPLNPDAFLSFVRRAVQERWIETEPHDAAPTGTAVRGFRRPPTRATPTIRRRRRRRSRRTPGGAARPQREHRAPEVRPMKHKPPRARSLDSPALATAAFAGGPIYTYDPVNRIPYAWNMASWPDGQVPVYTDLGDLGVLTNERANELVTFADEPVVERPDLQLQGHGRRRFLGARPGRHRRQQRRRPSSGRGTGAGSTSSTTATAAS